jgi:Cutinase
VVAAIVAVLLVLLTPVTPAGGACPDTSIIGARGSGQSGYGDQVGGVVEAAMTSLATLGRSVTADALDYPAISITDSFGLALFNGDYERSVEAGVEALEASLSDIATRCPATEVVLVGYSQGSQVIKLALQGVDPRLRIGGVILLADPMRDPTQRGIVRLGNPAVDRDGTFGALAVPERMRPVTIDVCADGDGICERGRRGFTAHIDGYTDAAVEVIPYLIADLDQRRSVHRGPR